MTTISNTIDTDRGRISQTDVYRIIDDLAEDCLRNRRHPKRTPIVASIDIETDDGIVIPAKIRDASNKGLGLVHHCTIPCGNVVLYFGSQQARKSYMFKLEWCRKVDDDTFISGGYFIWDLDRHISASQSASTSQSACSRLYRHFFGADVIKTDLPVR